MENSGFRGFEGHGAITSGNISCPSHVSGRYDIFGQSKVTCTLLVEDKHRKTLEEIFQKKNFAVSARLANGQTIWLRNLHSIQLSGPRLEAEGFEVVVGNRLPIQNIEGALNCTFYFPLTPVVQVRAARTRTLTGGIETTRKPGDEIVFGTPFGQATLGDSFQFLDRDYSPKDIAVEHHRGFLYFYLENPTITDWDKLVDELDKVTELPLLVLSFLSRRLIRWYELQLFFSPKDSSSGEFQIINLYRIGARDSYEDNYHLIEQAALSNGSFQTILDAFARSEAEIGTALRRAIAFLIASYDADLYLESSIVSTYTAIEILVSALSSHNGKEMIMTRSEFEQLREKLKTDLEELFGDAEMKKKQVLEKAGELRRRSLFERLVELLNAANVSFDDLWENEDSVQGLHEILKRRNDLIHRGSEVSSQYTVDEFRLRIILERWILQLLGFPLDHLSPLAYDRLLAIAKYPML